MTDPTSMSDSNPADSASVASDPMSFAAPPVRRWFDRAFPGGPTPAQQKGWQEVSAQRSTLLLAPTGSGKTLAAFLFALNELMFSPEPEKKKRCRVLYISPLKALGVDVERNLRAPIAGIRAEAAREEEAYRELLVGVRTGDTSQSDRAKMVRRPPDILITTPESLYLLLTSQARETLEHIETVIIDEIHSLVSTKRGVHLFLSLERLEAARTASTPLQRIGLSATQRPLEEVARLLGGGTVAADGSWTPRKVSIVDAGRKRDIDLRVHVPVEDMKELGQPVDEIQTGAASKAPPVKSIWPSIHSRLVDLIREHRSTMIFVNSRRLAERLAQALNEEAEAEIASAHHGSLSKEKRARVEDALKRGQLPAIVATSSLELGIDMGAVDLVVQIESPPSVASGIQRIGRAGHHVGAVSKGAIFPKHRGDLLACAAAVPNMLGGKVEATYYPRNPLDVLAQQIVAEVSFQPRSVDDLFQLFRGAAPFSDLPLTAFEGVLDMLSGRYPSEEFAGLRARVTWDRVNGRVEARHGARRVAAVNGGTIPDRGLYGVFLVDGSETGSRRVGELDEEMVFESRPGEVFLLGASSWRIEDITRDRVLVSPAPGEPGRMPFWRGDRIGRPVEFGRTIGTMTRELARTRSSEAVTKLQTEHRLDELAATNLDAYVRDQLDATGAVPSDDTIIFERFRDEVGDWRVCILSPFGSRVHAPWATAVLCRLSDEMGLEVDMMYMDDGLVFRLPEAETPPDPDLFFPRAEDVEALVVRKLASTSLFASHFRESAGRALLLPKRSPTQRTPLWAQRRKSADLLKVAAQFDRFPIVLETYRECLRDVFDLPALQELLGDINTRRIAVVVAETKAPSPFASSLLYTYVGNFLYDGDAPLAERRAQVLSIDHAQLRQLLGEAEMRTLLDPESIFEVERQLQLLGDEPSVRHADGLHDLLLSLGDLDAEEIKARASQDASVDEWIEQLVRSRRIVPVTIAGTPRYIAAEEMARYRDALGVVPPPGLPEAFLEPPKDPVRDLVSRYARSHGPFAAQDAAARFGLGIAPALQALQRLAEEDRVLEGEFLPNGRGSEWCDRNVLRRIKQKSLAKLRQEVEPVEPPVLARFLTEWHGLGRASRGLDAVLGVIEQLQGYPVPVSDLETEVLPSRVEDYEPSMLDELCQAGEVLWRGVEPIGTYDSRIALYLTDHFPNLAPRPEEEIDEDLEPLLEIFRARGAVFFPDLERETGAFARDLRDKLWRLVWAGWITNDSAAPLRSLSHDSQSNTGPRGIRLRGGRRTFRSRRLTLPGTEGRWSLLRQSPSAVQIPEGPTETERRTAVARQLLDRYGVLVREAPQAEGWIGGFSYVYPVLKALEESGKIRRGYFVAGLGATQFALPGAEDRLRGFRNRADESGVALVLAATDPANPYGSILPWPEKEGTRPARAAGAQVLLHQGRLLGYLGRSERALITFLPEDEPERTQDARVLAKTLSEMPIRNGRRALHVTKIDGESPGQSFLAPFLAENGFSATYKGLFKRRQDARG